MCYYLILMVMGLPHSYSVVCNDILNVATSSTEFHHDNSNLDSFIIRVYYEKKNEKSHAYHNNGLFGPVFPYC
jgi:hypothetical protein